MSFTEVKEQVLRMSDAQRRKLMNILLGVRSQHSDKWFAELERRQRRLKRGESVSRAQILEKYGITEAEIRAEGHWWNRGSGS